MDRDKQGKKGKRGKSGKGKKGGKKVSKFMLSCSLLFDLLNFHWNIAETCFDMQVCLEREPPLTK